jgi:hypothetical protein
MSSPEAVISEIQDYYEKLVVAVDLLRHKQNYAEPEILDLLKLIVDFQRKIEYHKEAMTIFSDNPYFKRTIGSFETIIGYFQTETTLREVYTSRYADSFQVYHSNAISDFQYSDVMQGINFETKEMLVRTRARSISAVQRSLSMMDDFLHEKLHPALIELYGDLRLLASLMIFPVEQKMKIKDILLEKGFDSIVEFLETAEHNYVQVPPHLKDTLSNCRNALEAMVTTLVTRTDQKPTQRFSTDMATLLNTGLLDRETKDVVLSVWSYLSMKGSHSYSQVDKKSISDVDFGIEQTYRIISQMLTKYQTWLTKT